MVLSCRGQGSALVCASVGDRRIEDEPDTKLVKDLCGSSDVIALRVRQHYQRDVAKSSLAKLPGHVGLGCALVDEDGSSWHLHEGAVALPDVEEGDAEAVRRWHCR